MATFIRRALENRQETSVREFSESMRAAFDRDSVPRVEGQARSFSYSENLGNLTTNVSNIRL